MDEWLNADISCQSVRGQPVQSFNAVRFQTRMTLSNLKKKDKVRDWGILAFKI